MESPSVKCIRAEHSFDRLVWTLVTFHSTWRSSRSSRSSRGSGRILKAGRGEILRRGISRVLPVHFTPSLY